MKPGHLEERIALIAASADPFPAQVHGLQGLVLVCEKPSATNEALRTISCPAAYQSN